jgi:hypothetical protein
LFHILNQFWNNFNTQTIWSDQNTTKIQVKVVLYSTAILHGITTQRTSSWNFTTMKTSKSHTTELLALVLPNWISISLKPFLTKMAGHSLCWCPAGFLFLCYRDLHTSNLPKNSLCLPNFNQTPICQSPCLHAKFLLPLHDKLPWP